MPRQITPSTTLENLKREAKRWLKALHAKSGEARDRLERALPDTTLLPTLRDVQHALALEHGLPGWTALKNRLAQDAPMRRYDKVAEALVTAYRTGEESAMRIVWHYFGHMRAWDAMRRYVRLDLGRTEQPQSPEDDTITLAEARYLVARFQGFESWESLAAYAASVPPGKATIATKSIAFPALRELMPMDVPDDGYRHVGRCEQLESLVLMYCRETTDAATEHIAQLSALKKYFASYNRIADRTPEILSGMPSLEEHDAGGSPASLRAACREHAKGDRRRCCSLRGSRPREIRILTIWTPSLFAIGLPMTLAAYYLAWKHLVARLNDVLGIA